MRARVPALTATLGLLAVCVAAGCGEGRKAPTAPSAISPVAQAYLDELIAIMEAHSINRLKIDWSAFRTSVVTAAGAAQTIEDTFPAIVTALTLLGDGHSFYRARRGTAMSGPRRPCGAPGSAVPTLPGNVGYVRVGSFSGSAAEAAAFANAIQSAIASADRDDLAGWIVDLRGNGGGNMWPMIAGVGPVLGEGRAGYFIDPVGTEIVWEYRDGASWEGGSLSQRVDAPYRLRRQSPKVAVLIDSGTASSGEAVVIAFQRRPDTRSFGTATCGLSTANQEYTMSDGASLFLTEAVMADRTKAPYGGQILPDEEVLIPRETEQRAVAWLQSGDR
jgi:carboxyl-terminal processing protease